MKKMSFFSFAATFKMLTVQIVSVLCIVLVTGCSKDPVDPAAPDNASSVALSEINIRKANIRQVASMLRKLYMDPEIVAEVNAAIKSGYYQDERIALKDLLKFTQSPIYATKDYQQQKQLSKVKFGVGKFATKFLAIVAQDKNARVNGDYYSEGGYNIYWPYSENFEQNSTPTVVDATEDTDRITVQDPYGCGSEATLDCNATITVDDFYATTHVTHIVGDIQATPTTAHETKADINKVFLGWVRCTTQYDRLISFTGNGGGSELRFCRGTGYLKLDANQQVTSFEDIISMDVSRRSIRNGDWIRVYSIWDSNWQEDNNQQVFAIYEDDTQGESKIEGSVTTKISSTEVKPIGYSITVKTQDAIIRQINWDRASFFADAHNDQGGGLQDGWPIYDSGTGVAYTLPYTVIPQ